MLPILFFLSLKYAQKGESKKHKRWNNKNLGFVKNLGFRVDMKN